MTGDGALGNGPGPPCPAFPTDFESHFNPQPLGTNVISTPTTAGTSGIIFRAGSPEALGKDPEVKRVYLGEGFNFDPGSMRS